MADQGLHILAYTRAEFRFKCLIKVSCQKHWAFDKLPPHMTFSNFPRRILF